MKTLKLFLLTLLLFAASISAQVSTVGNFKFYGNKATSPSVCSSLIGSLYYDTAAKVFKYCSATNTWSSLAGGGGGTGILQLNGLTADPQTFAVGTSGTNFNIVSSGSTHTFNIPTASATNRGLFSTTDYSALFGSKPANFVYAAPSGSSGAPTFRALVAADVPFAVPTTRQIIPGDGIMGGGALSGDVTISLDIGSLPETLTPESDFYLPVYDDSTATYFKISRPNFLTGIGGGASSPLTLTANNASEVPITLKGAASQTAWLTRWQNNASTNVLGVAPDGDLVGTNFASFGEQYFEVNDGSCVRMVVNTNGFIRSCQGGATIQAGGIPIKSDGNGSWYSEGIVNGGVPTLGTSSNRWSSVFFDRTVTASGTTGAQTINKAAFAVNFAASATSLVVTNSLVTTSTMFLCTVQGNDSTMKSISAVPASGSVTLYPNSAPSAETRVYCEARN